MIRLFHEYRAQGKLKNLVEKRLILFLKYLFLIIFSNDWIIVDNKGMYSIFGKLTIINLMKKLRMNIIVHFIGILIFVTSITSIIYIFFINNKLERLEYDIFQVSFFKKFLDCIFSFLRIIYFFIFNYTLEILSLMVLNFDSLCNFQDDFKINNNTEFINSIRTISNQTNSILIDCSSKLKIDNIWIVFSSIFFIIAVLFNYINNVAFVTAYSIDPLDFSGEYDKSDNDWLFLIIINIFMIFDIYFQINKFLFYTKITLRILYSIYFIFTLKINYSQKDIVERFLGSFCFFSCILELIYLKDFLNKFDFDISSDKLNLISLNFSEENIEKYPFLYFYNWKFVLMKFINNLFLGLILIFIKEILENRKITNIFEGTYNNGNFFKYYFRLFFILNEMKNKPITTQVKFYGEFYKNLKIHIENCVINECDCIIHKKYIENFYIHLLIKKKNIKVYENFILHFIKLNIESVTKNSNLNNKIPVHIIIIINTIFNFYFKNFFITSFFNVEKLLNLEQFKNNKFAEFKLRLFKLEIISSFIKNNMSINTGRNQYFNYLYTRFNSFINLLKIQDSSLKSFLLYRDININLNRNICNYHYTNFKEDLTKLCDNIFLFDKKIEVLKKMSENKNYNNYYVHDSCDFNNFILFRNIKIYLKYFHDKDFILEEISKRKTKENSKNSNKSLFQTPVEEKFNNENNTVSKYKFQINKNSICDNSTKIPKENSNKTLLKTNNLEYDNKSNYSKSFSILEGKRYNIDNNSNNNNNKKSLTPINLNFETKEQIECLIVRQTKDKSLILDKVTPKFAEDLQYKTTDLVGKDINNFLPDQFIEYHQSHVLGFLKKNNLLVKNKEVFFTGKNGYCINYYISGTIILTLNNEVIFYIELKKINFLNVKYQDKLYICCDLIGEIIGYDKTITKHLFIDSDSMNIIKPNFFKNFLNISNQKIDFEQENLILKISYLRLIRHINYLDYNKIIDKKQFSKNNFYLNKLNYNIKLFSNLNPKLKIPIYLTKRNLLKKYYFYDIRMDFSELKKIINLNKPKFFFNNKFVFKKKEIKNTNFYNSDNIKMNLIKFEIIKKLFENTQALTLIYSQKDIKDSKSLINMNKILFFYQYLCELYFFSNIEKSNLVKSIVDKFNKINYIFKNNIFRYEISFTLIFLLKILFLTFFFIFLFSLNLINDDILIKIRAYKEISYLITLSKGLTLTITSSVFSINFIKNKIEDEYFYLKNHISNNSYDFHINRIKKYSDLLLDYSYKYNLFYNEYYSLLFKYKKHNESTINQNYFNENFEIQELNYNFIVSNNNYTLNNYFIIQHHLCYNFNREDIIISDFFLYNFTQNNYKAFILKTDQSRFFFQENIITKLNIQINKLINSLYMNLEEFLSHKTIYICYMYISIFFLIEIYIIVNFIYFRKYFNYTFIKHYKLFNVLKVFNIKNLKKTNLILEIITDYTEEGLNMLKKRPKISNDLKMSIRNNQNLNDSLNKSFNIDTSEKGDNLNNQKTLIEYFIKPEIKKENTIEIEINIYKIFYTIFKDEFHNKIETFKKILSLYESLQNNKIYDIKKKLYLTNYERIYNNNNEIPYEKSFLNENVKNNNLPLINVINEINQSEIIGKDNQDSMTDNIKRKFRNKLNILKIFKKFGKKDLEKSRVDIDEMDKNKNNLDICMKNSTESSINKTDTNFIKNSNLVLHNKFLKEVKNEDNDLIENIYKKLLNVNQDNILNLFNNDEKSRHNEPFMKYEEFTKPKIYGIILKINFFNIIFIIIYAVFMVVFIRENFATLSTNYKFLHLFSQKNLIIFEIFLIFKHSLINFEEASFLSPDNFKNSNYIINTIIYYKEKNNPSNLINTNKIILFEETLKNYENIVIEIKKFMDYPFLADIRTFENEFNSKSFCDKYANFTYFKNFNNHSNNENNSEFEFYRDSCLKDSMGLNQFGLQQSLDTMINIIKNFYLDLKDLIFKDDDLYFSLKSRRESMSYKKENNNNDSRNNFNDSNIEKIKKIAKKFTKNNSYRKITANMNTFIFETWLYQINFINDFLIRKEDEILMRHDIIHFLIYIVVLIICFFNIFSFYFIIHKPNNLIDFSYNLIYNSIKYNILNI